MSPSKRLKPVQRVAESKEQKAARHMGQSRKNLQAEEVKLNQLKQYHQEYLERFETAARKGISASQLQEYRAFLGKLDRAIQQQEDVVRTSKLNHSTHQHDWRKQHTRTQALNKAVSRFQTQERATADRNEQKETDDRNQRLSKA
ncbi:MAG: flagellar export protein FliJ [Gammaproteobacteria bacterium]|nr:flagellar export protein FliJ [Gammaproteobacteria bacterium]